MNHLAVFNGVGRSTALFSHIVDIGVPIARELALNSVWAEPSVDPSTL